MCITLEFMAHLGNDTRHFCVIKPHMNLLNPCLSLVRNLLFDNPKKPDVRRDG